MRVFVGGAWSLCEQEVIRLGSNCGPGGCQLTRQRRDIEQLEVASGPRRL